MKRVVKLLFEIGTLKKIIRGHRQVFLTDDLSDNIASHSHRVSVIGYFIAKKENADIEKVLKMCIFHDIGETRSGDQTWIHKNYVTVDDEKILEEQLNNITADNDLFSILQEYRKRNTLEAKVTKDADNLDQYLLVKEYSQKGNHEAAEWLDPEVIDLFHTKTAKEIYANLIKIKPSEWTDGLYINERKS